MLRQTANGHDIDYQHRFMFILLIVIAISNLVCGANESIKTAPFQKSSLRSKEAGSPLIPVQEVPDSFFPKLHNRHFNPQRKVTLVPLALDIPGKHPGWFYYNLVLSPDGSGCDDERTIAMQYGYQKDTCLVVYDDASNNDDVDNNAVVSSIKFTCTNSGNAVQTTYSDSSCGTVDAETILGTVGQCAGTDSVVTNFIQYLCTDEERFPVGTKRDYAVLQEYNVTACNNPLFITAVTAIRTQFCILPEDVNSKYSSVFITNRLVATYYSDVNCFVDPEEETLKQSCSAIEIDDDAARVEVGQRSRWRFESDGDADDDVDDDDEAVTDDTTDDDIIACFTADSVVTSESRGEVAISTVRVGDRILVQQADGQLQFSDVVFIPHQANSIAADFIELTTDSGRTLTATLEHLILTTTTASVATATTVAASEAIACRSECSLIVTSTSSELVKMRQLRVGDYIATLQGAERIVQLRHISSSSDVGSGVYTIVAEDAHGHIVVNGVIASSFGTNHLIPNTFYSIHRFLYRHLQLGWMLAWESTSALNLSVGGTAVRCWYNFAATITAAATFVAATTPATTTTVPTRRLYSSLH